uniref:Uncharacterized protein n=1 Tax=Trichogramma kaykai TaxID=54128 RepID=A0ABD2X323_9HYME
MHFIGIHDSDSHDLWNIELMLVLFPVNNLNYYWRLIKLESAFHLLLNYRHDGNTEIFFTTKGHNIRLNHCSD